MQPFEEKQFLRRGAIISLDSQKVWVGSGDPTSEGPSIYTPDFFLKGKQVRRKYQAYQEMEPQALLSQLSSRKEPSRQAFSLYGEDVFRSTIASFKEQSRLKKIVPYLFLKARGRFDHASALISLLTQALGTHYFVYGAWDESGGILGATPEILFQKERSCLKTMAVAGTVESSKQDQLATQEKDVYEHALVVEGITRSLQAIGPNSQIYVHKCRAVPFTALSHLVTPITADYSHTARFETCVEALHPTPALGAFPKEEGRSWLKDYHLHLPRQKFGAPFGLVREDHSICLVAIRNVQWQEEMIKIGAGCGVVHESVLDNELKEVKLKLDSTKKMLGLI